MPTLADERPAFVAWVAPSWLAEGYGWTLFVTGADQVELIDLRTNDSYPMGALTTVAFSSFICLWRGAFPYRAFRRGNGIGSGRTRTVFLP